MLSHGGSVIPNFSLVIGHFILSYEVVTFSKAYFRIFFNAECKAAYDKDFHTFVFSCRTAAVDAALWPPPPSHHSFHIPCLTHSLLLPGGTTITAPTHWSWCRPATTARPPSSFCVWCYAGMFVGCAM